MMSRRRPAPAATANHKPSSQHGSCKVPLEHPRHISVTGGHSWNKRRSRGQPAAGGGCPYLGAQQRSSAAPEPFGLQQLHSLQQRIGSAHIKLEEKSALRRCPPSFWQSISQRTAGLRAKHVSCNTSSCPPHASDVELGGSAELRRAAALCRPALLDGAAQPLPGEAGGRVLLVDPVAPGVLV